ncbi:MAG: branched-chain amino acid ABC transporter permease [Peptococcaceae bacterium]|nr:branched-chain amino acid ABC transporter permease [Peptococcaceae bacterium]
MQEITQSVLNGILLGGLYAVIGIGMSLVFGIMGLTNLAHGDLMILGTFFCMVLAAQFTGSMLLALLLTTVIMTAIGFLLQNFLVNRVIGKGPEPSLLVTFGVSVFLQNLLLLWFGADAQSIKSQWATKNIITTDLFSVSAVYLLNFLVGIAVILALHYLMQHTYFGRSIRATSDDVIAAELMGVNTKRIYAYTMCIAMITAAIAGLLVGMTFVFYPTTGTPYLIIAFGVVVIGGMGSLIGTLMGGMVLGLAQLLGSYFFGSGYQLFIGYLVLLLLLTFKPEGLLSAATRK